MPSGKVGELMKSMPEIHPGVIGLNGGAKQFWLRINRRVVLSYYQQNGYVSAKQNSPATRNSQAAEEKESKRAPHYRRPHV